MTRVFFQKVQLSKWLSWLGGDPSHCHILDELFQPKIHGLVSLGKSFFPETIDVPMKIMGLSGFNFPLNQSIDNAVLIHLDTIMWGTLDSIAKLGAT